MLLSSTTRSAFTAAGGSLATTAKPIVRDTALNPAYLRAHERPTCCLWEDSCLFNSSYSRNAHGLTSGRTLTVIYVPVCSSAKITGVT